MKKPGTFTPGHVKIRTIAGKEHKVAIVARGKEEYEYLRELLRRFCPEVLKD